MNARSLTRLLGGVAIAAGLLRVVRNAVPSVCEVGSERARRHGNSLERANFANELGDGQPSGSHVISITD